MKQTIPFIFKFFILAFALLQFQPASADLPPKNKKAIAKLKKQSKGLISERIFKSIERAYDLASGKNYSQAIKTLKEQQGQSYAKEGEKAELLRHIGFIYAQKEDYPSAIQFLQKSLDTKKLSYDLYLNTFFTIIHIQMTVGGCKQGEPLLKKWFSLSEKERPQAYILYASCLLEKKQTDKALKYVEKTIASVNEPQESWLRFALSLNLKKGNYKKSRVLLEKLVAQFPKRKIYWKQLAGVYLHLEDNKKALVTLELAYKMGFLDSKTQLLNLARLLVDQKTPYKAAQLIKSNLKTKLKEEEKNLEIMAESYMLARERKSALSLFSKLFIISKKPKTLSKYAYLLLQEEQWKNSEKVFQKILSLKEEHPKKETIYLGLGISLFYQGQYNLSLKHFKKSFEINSDQSAAFHWIQYAETMIKEQKKTKDLKI